MQRVTAEAAGSVCERSLEEVAEVWTIPEAWRGSLKRFSQADYWSDICRMSPQWWEGSAPPRCLDVGISPMECKNTSMNFEFSFS